MIPNNLNSIKKDSTNAYFNNVYKPNFTVTQGEDDAVLSFFEKLTGNKENGAALARAFIFTVKAQGLDLMTVFQQFVILPPGQLNSYLVMLLNMNRVGTSLLGLSNKPLPNKYIMRSILP